MSAIRTTMAGGYLSADVQVVPYLHEREIDSILDAIGAGDLVAVAETGRTPGAGEIVALAAPSIAETIVKRGEEELKALHKALADAQKELRALTTIIGEVFAEDEPRDHVWKLESAADDVKTELENAIDLAEEMG